MRPVPAVRIDGGPAASLIRARESWLLALDPGCGFDLDAMRDEVKLCDGPDGCGTELDTQEITKLVSELSQAPTDLLMLAGKPAVAYRLGSSRTVYRFDHDRDLAAVLHQFRAAPPAAAAGTQPAVGPAAVGPEFPCCPGCGRCQPKQCQGPPPPPAITITDLERCDCEGVCAARKNGTLPADCPCAQDCEPCP